MALHSRISPGFCETDTPGGTSARGSGNLPRAFLFRTFISTLQVEGPQHIIIRYGLAGRIALQNKRQTVNATAAGLSIPPLFFVLDR
jgi:hypothetical protein